MNVATTLNEAKHPRAPMRAPRRAFTAQPTSGVARHHLLAATNGTVPAPIVHEARARTTTIIGGANRATNDLSNPLKPRDQYIKTDAKAETWRAFWRSANEYLQFFRAMLEATTTEEADPLEELRELADDWDGEGAPRPSDGALSRAYAFISGVRNDQLAIYEIDADVLGGVAVWIRGGGGGRAWLAFMNSGRNTLVLSRNGDVSYQPWGTPAAYDALLRFARTEE